VGSALAVLYVSDDSAVKEVFVVIKYLQGRSDSISFILLFIS